MIKTNREQEAAAKSCGKSFCCLSRDRTTNPFSWKVALATNDQETADSWWEQQAGAARVYYSNGAIRNAK